MKKIAFIINSTVRKLKPKLREIKNVFDTNNYQLTFYFSKKNRHIEDLCEQAVSEGHPYLIFVGGDGTLNEGINGLLKTVRREQKKQLSDYHLPSLQAYKVGVLPAGSGNDFSKTLGKNHSAKSLQQKIESDSYQAIDIGYMHYFNEEKEPDTRFFINISDVGIGGVVAQKIIHKNAAFSPDWVYLKAIFTSMMNYKNQTVHFQSDTEQWEDKIKSLIFANGVYFGSGLGIAPNARLDSGHFEIIKMGDISIWDYLKHIPNLKKKQIIQHPEVTYSQAKNFSVRPLDQQDLPIDMDGEFIGYAPLSVTCVPQSILFIS